MAPAGQVAAERAVIAECYERLGCGHNVIDAAAAEAIVAEAVKARLGDPRRAGRIAARLARVREQRTPLEAEQAWNEESLLRLAQASLGVRRARESEPLSRFPGDPAERVHFGGRAV